MNPRELIARRAAQELKDGQVVNLGFGIPTQAVNYLPEGVKLIFHTENGGLGFGPTPQYSDADSDNGNAGGEPISLPPGSSVFSVSTSFAIMRKGLLDITILGALEVDQQGNIANWAVKRNGKWWPGIGGAMDLTHGTKYVVACLMHQDNKGESKIKARCELPVTGKNCVKVIITEKAVFGVGDGKLILREAAPGVSIDDIRACTEAEFVVADDFHEMMV